jgi:hypothetical protein
MLKTRSDPRTCVHQMCSSHPTAVCCKNDMMYARCAATAQGALVHQNPDFAADHDFRNPTRLDAGLRLHAHRSLCGVRKLHRHGTDSHARSHAPLGKQGQGPLPFNRQHAVVTQKLRPLDRQHAVVT